MEGGRGREGRRKREGTREYCTCPPKRGREGRWGIEGGIGKRGREDQGREEGINFKPFQKVKDRTMDDLIGRSNSHWRNSSEQMSLFVSAYACSRTTV